MALGNLRHALLGLIASKPDGAHGYALKDECEAISDDFWSLNYGRLYRVLDELERAGALSVVQEVQRGKPSRNVYRITEKGRRDLDDWLLSPVDPKGKPLRDELVLKLLFLGVPDVERVRTIIQQQRRIYLTRLARLTRRRRKLEKAGIDSFAATLVMDGAEMRVRADLAWLQSIEQRLVRAA